MTDPQLPPPSGAVPPVPPAPQGADTTSPQMPPVPPVTPPVAQPSPAFPTEPPAYPAQPPAYPAQPPAFTAQPPAFPTQPPTYPAAAGIPAPGPAYQAPPGAYQVPVGGYAAPAGAYAAPEAASVKPKGLLGTLSLILAVVAAIVIPIIAGVSGFEIGRHLPSSGFDSRDPEFLSLLSPARDQVLWTEISFWAGTVLGIAAIVVGIIAIAKKQRRGLGIAGLILAVIGAGGFWVILLFSVSIGTATGLGGS
ncbi:hypothetical protein [Microbacterium sp. NPDC057944]|uniref:hypothetical protein n=1 Tax=Microbacterium sp. NPDC057944 TaxID=3346286 RepID=UPI0036D884E3